MSNIVKQKKLRLGFVYGIVAGLTFSVFTWGLDAVLLARAHDLYYWIKFVPGVIISLLVGGTAGGLTVSIRKHGFAFLIWGLTALLLSWLAIWLPLTGSPIFVKLINPGISSLISYPAVQDIGQFRLISLLAIGLAALICGLLELNLIDQAILSPYISGSVLALLVCFILFGIAGSAVDHLINTNLREPVQVIDTLLQFAQDNVGRDVPKTKAREMHLSATNQLGTLVQKSRRLTLISIDEDLLTMGVLVDFEGTKVKCTTIFSQPTDCIILTSNR
jgi:hypothetical protein